MVTNADVLCAAEADHDFCYAVSCTFDTGSCTASPCPGSILQRWGDCILTPLANTGMCPPGCKELENSDNPNAPGICALNTASRESISTAERDAVVTCTATPSQECILAQLSLLEETGCVDCLGDIIELGTRNDQCSGTAGAAACTAIDTPCAGEAAGSDPI